MKPGPGLAVLLLLAGCGRGGEPANGAAASTNQIERLSTPKVEEPDPTATARLQPMTAADLTSEGLTGAGCFFTRDERLLLAAVGSDAIIRIGSALRHLVPSAPVGGTGGFFEDRQIGVSVGRTGEQGTLAGEEAMSWPARLTVTNRRTRAETRLAGTWTCGS